MTDSNTGEKNRCEITETMHSLPKNNDIEQKIKFVSLKFPQLLKEKYFRQLEIYKKALEISLNRSVDEIYIYATKLNKLIYL